jgi:hypothetical protein
VNMVVVQGVVCLLISLWGVVMLMLGIVWAQAIWVLLGVAVLIVGLPFVRNMLPRDDSSRHSLLPP